MNQLKKQIELYKTNRKHIERMLKWTPLEYAEFQWEMMEDYILSFSGGDVESLELYGRSTSFRKWWVNQWNLRDLIIVEELEYLAFTHDMRIHYKHIHSAPYLLKNTILQDGESMVVGRVIDELHQRKNK